jgi:hypothetical protein
MRKIMAQQRIIARDQNKLFVERASAGRQSARDIEEEYDLDEGKGNAFVEFEIEPELLRVQYNRRLRMNELYIVGDVNLNGRNAVGSTNH